MKRLTAILLALILSASVLTGCSDQNSGETNAAPGAEGETAAEEIEEEEVLSDNLPEKKFDGYTFSVAAFEEQIAIEEETGEALNDAMFHRDVAVEDRFDIELYADVFGDFNAAGEAVKRSATAGTDDFDCGFLHMVNAATAASGGYFFSLNKLEYLDPSRPWWDSDCVDAFSVGDDMMLICGIILPNSMLRSSCLAFNKNRFDDYAMEYPYSIVEEGGWTLDKLYELTKDVTKDLNGDGVIKETDDFFGLTQWYLDSPYSFYYGGGGTIIEDDENGLPFINMNLEFNTALYEKIFRVVIENKSNYHTDIGTYEQAYETFSQGRALFCEASLSHFTGARFREMEDDYGALPMPKFDEKQEKYLSFVNGCVSMLCVPASVSDPERTGYLLEGIAFESYKYIYDVLFDVTAKAKSARDEESTHMMDLIMENRAFDFGYAHMYDQSVTNFVRDLLSKGSTDVASTLQKSEKVLSKMLNKLVQSYQENYQE